MFYLFCDYAHLREDDFLFSFTRVVYDHNVYAHLPMDMFFLSPLFYVFQSIVNPSSQRVLLVTVILWRSNKTLA